MDAAVLPLAFYCRNAQLYLQKVAESRKLNLGEEELQHLKAFTSLVTSSIPTHPQFRGWNNIQEIQPVDLHAHITEAKQRIKELEDASHVDKPSPTTNGLKPGTRRPTSSKPVEPSRFAVSKSVTSPRSKLNSPSKFSSEVMLKTGKSVRISEAVPKQRPQRWDITMTDTYGVSKTAKPVSLIQRLKRGTVAPPAESKASPTRAPTGKVDVPRPSSAHGVHNPAPGEITSFRPIPRSRDSSRIRGGAGPSMPPSGRGSTALKALTSSSVKVRILDEDCSQRLNSSNRGMRDSADNGVNNRGGGSSSSSARPAYTSKLANHPASGGPCVRGILRNGSEDTVTDSYGAMVKTNLEDEEELITWIPVPSRNEKSRVQRRSSNEGGYGEDSLESESRQRDHDQGEELRRHTPARGVREWNGGYVRGEQSLDESMDATGTAAQGLRATEGSRRSVESRPASAPVRRAPARVVKVTSPSSGVQRSGVKENCERFRHQMRMLKEKAEDTRMREEEVESMAERLQRQLEGEIDLDGVDIWRNSTQIHEEDESEEFCEVHRVGRSIDQPGLERTSLESLDRTMTRLINGDYTDPSTPSVERIGLANQKIKTVAGSASNSGSSGTSSQSSLPLSHYIQKLRESRLKNATGNSTSQHRFEVMEHKSSAENGDSELTVSRIDSCERRELSLSASSPGSSTPAILLPSSSSTGSPKGSHQHPPPSHHGKRLKSQVYHKSVPKSDSSSVAMVRTSPGSGAMVAGSYARDGGKLQDRQALYYPPDESRVRALSRSIYETTQHGANDEKIAHLQRVLGELKGSMEGVKIRIEVEGEGWRGRVDRLEKDLESMKEADEDIIAAKHNFKNELKMKLSEFMADTEKLLLREREQVQVMVEERIEKQLKAQHLAEMKDEMHLLWNEMDSLIKSREDIAGHVEHLTFFTKKVQEHSSREQAENGLLRKQLQSLKADGVQVSSETDKEDLRQAVEKLKNDGNDMKLDIQGLKNIEKILKVELGDLRIRLGKVQDETEELEREKEMTLVEGARERLLIMERVESLSQLYLGGLEEVRQDLGHVKLGFSERVDEIESQWNDFNRYQGITCEEGSNLLPRQVLLDELDQFRSEIAEMVDIERGLLKETLEKESTSIWRNVMDAYANNKSEMLNMLKLEIQKQLHSAREKVLLMTDALKCDLDALRTELNNTQNGAEDLAQIILAAEGQKEVAAQAAAEASSSATKAREILTDMLVSVGSEVSNARHESMQLQEKLATEKDMAIAAVSEARLVSEAVLKEKEAALAAFQEVRQKSHELQDYLEKESPKLLTAMVVVQKERDTASQAAAEATSSAMKAGELLGEVLGSFNVEMAKARHINMQLQEELEHERGLGSQHSQEVQDRISEELEVAIATWKQTMNEEVDKAKEIAEGVLGNEHLRQLSGLSTPLDLESYVLKTEEKLSSLMATIEHLQDSTTNYRDEKKRLEQHENERNEKDWAANMNQLNQAIAEVESRVAVVECTIGDIQNGGQSEKAKIGSLTGNFEALLRKMVILEQNGILSDQEPVTGARVIGLENRMEHVASATFSNLQLLDNKVERVSMGVQSALEGAALAENKCGALGAELVKVFRMLTTTKNSNSGTNWPQLTTDNCNNDNTRVPRSRSLSPPVRRAATQRLESRSQSPPPRLNENPAWNSSRGPPSPLRRSGGPTSRTKAGIAREKRIGVRGRRNVDEGNQNSELRKAEARERADRAKELEAELEPGMTSQGGSPPRDDNWLKSYPRESLSFKEGRFPGQALTVAERTGPYMSVDQRAKNLQKTNIRLEAGRIHVNVSRRSGAASVGQADKRGDAIAVQS